MGESHRDRERWNAVRFVAGDVGGHYESWFQRANHPSRPLAFWIHYTIFCPRAQPQAAVGELCAIAGSYALDAKAAKRLWEISERAVGITGMRTL